MDYNNYYLFRLVFSSVNYFSPSVYQLALSQSIFDYFLGLLRSKCIQWKRDGHSRNKEIQCVRWEEKDDG